MTYKINILNVLIVKQYYLICNDNVLRLCFVNYNNLKKNLFNI